MLVVGPLLHPENSKLKQSLISPDSTLNTFLETADHPRSLDNLIDWTVFVCLLTEMLHKMLNCVLGGQNLNYYFFKLNFDWAIEFLCTRQFLSNVM